MRLVIMVLTLLFMAVPAEAGVMAEVFAPGRPGFTLILLFGIGLFCGAIGLIMDVLQQRIMAKYASLVAMMSGVCLVLDVLYLMLSKFLKLFGLSL